MTEAAASGGCQCGRIRYTVDLTVADAYLCHCKMCRRATGSPAAALVGVPYDAVTWARAPEWYASSPIGERAFCAACGTPLGMRYPDETGNIDLTLGSFDDPGRFAPSHNYAIESVLPAWQDTSHLDGTRTQDNAGVVDRWMKSVGKLPD